VKIVDRIRQQLTGQVLEPDEADLLISLVRARTRARTAADMRVVVTEPLLMSFEHQVSELQAMSADSDDYPDRALALCLAVPLLLDEVRRLRGER